MNQRNENGYCHGYWEGHHSNGQLCYKGHYDNGNRIGYREDYYSDGKLMDKELYI